VVYKLPKAVRAELDAKANRLTFSSADRQLLGQVCAEIRRLRAPDPYKGKGIKYADEVIRRKVGKAGAK
jgi:large subunit ribosomal protein L6